MHLFVDLLFGHALGDFFFQPKSMAVQKGSNTATAVTHVAIYTFCVLLATWPLYCQGKGLDFLWHYYGWAALIFVPHYIIDRYSLADRWLTFMNSRPLEGFLQDGHKDVPPEFCGPSYNNYIILRGTFSGICYVVVDNMSHLMCLWFGAKLLFNV